MGCVLTPSLPDEPGRDAHADVQNGPDHRERPRLHKAGIAEASTALGEGTRGHAQHASCAHL